MVNKDKKKQDYTAEDIYVLKGLEPVRKRPGMYIGSTGPQGLHHLIWEVVDNSLDEAMAGFCDDISITLLPDGKVKCQDNGRGIPVEKHKATGKSALETVMTTLHAGAKFGSKAYQVAGGLHGVGVSVVCALSKYTKAQVCRNGEKYVQEYSRGKVLTGVRKEGKCEGSGTTIIFEPDPKIFQTTEFNSKIILNHLRQQAYLTPNTWIRFKDERQKPAFEYQFYFDGGIRTFVRHLRGQSEPLHPHIFYVKQKDPKTDIIVEIAFQYAQDIESEELGFANNIQTEEGGTHITGFRLALTRELNNYARENGFLKKEDNNFTGNDVRSGLIAVVSVKLKEPQFEGQTKAKLGNPEVQAVVKDIFSSSFRDFLERNPEDAREIIKHCLVNAKARRAAIEARASVLKKSKIGGTTLPGKLADCSSRNPEDSELYIVEGDSAGGSSKMARDRRIQAILPLRGKVINVEKAPLYKIIKNEELKSLIIALGAAIADDFNINKLRYQRIIIMCDADSDGNHIRTLLLTLFFRYFREVIERGYLYIAQPPLYKIQIGNQIEYAYNESEKERILQDWKKKKKKNIDIQRYKGLGEMNPEELWETTMNPKNRVLLRVTIDDAQEADEIFDKLMGKEVLPRKKFIQSYAREVKNLDI